MKKSVFAGIAALVIGLALIGCDTGGNDGGSTAFKLSGDVYEQGDGGLFIASDEKTARTGTITASPGNARAKLSNSHFSITIGDPPDTELEDLSAALFSNGLDGLLGEAGVPPIELNPSSGVKGTVLVLTLDDTATIQKLETEIALTSLSAKSVVYVYVDNDISITIPDWTYTIPIEGVPGAELLDGMKITIKATRTILALKKGWNPLYMEGKGAFNLLNMTSMTITVSYSVKDADLKWVLGSSVLPEVD